VNGLYYIVIRKDLQTIQIILNQLQNFSDFVKQVAANSSSGEASSLAANLPTLGLRMALAVASILPILLLYPFFQKQFVKGIVIAGVKG
jgi:putative aldouronate transport system permease protein